MKKMLLLAALALCASPVYAAPDRFAQMDKDGDGQVDWKEFEAAIPGMKRPAFDTIDADKSGGISREEWESFMKNHMGGQKMPPAGMGMGKTMPPAGMGKTMPPAEMGKTMPPAGMGEAAPSEGTGGKAGMPLIQPPAQNAEPARK